MKKALQVINDYLIKSIEEGRVKWVKLDFSKEFANLKFGVSDEPEIMGNFKDEFNMLLTQLKWESYIKSYQMVDIENKTLLSLKF